MSRHHPLTSCLPLLFIALLSQTITLTSAHAQLTVLSKGNAALEWQKLQLSQIAAQLSDKGVTGGLRQELEAQQKWLQTYKVGRLTEEPIYGSAIREVEMWVEPILDPSKKSSKIREKLLGPKATPTSKDTEQLRSALGEFPEDIGLRQLQLHWLDQPQYRDAHAKDIADAAERLAGLLDGSEIAGEEKKKALAFTWYRQARALGYRQDPDVVLKHPLSDEQRKEVDAKLVGTYTQLIELVGNGRPEFSLLEIRMLRRDKWFGRALDVLENNGASIEPRWFLEKRRDLLRDLNWKPAADEANTIFAAAFPSEAKEN
jgi:hypothetical protein